MLALLLMTSAHALAPPGHRPSSLAQVQDILTRGVPRLLRVELRLQATGQIRPISPSALSVLRVRAAEPKTDPAFRQVYSLETQLREGNRQVWVALPDSLAAFFRSDVTLGTSVRVLALVAGLDADQPVLLLEGFETDGQAGKAGR